MIARALLIGLVLAMSACVGGLKLTRLEAAHRRPANVAVFFTAEDQSGEPVADLLASDFHIYEDGALVSIDESRQTIVNPEIAATHHTLLLVDMSASVTESDQVQAIAAAAESFVQEVSPYQKVAVYAFDGSKDIAAITPFTNSGSRMEKSISSLENYRTRDPSTNLHGAVVQALRVLDQATRSSKAPLNYGTLVVFTDGTDRASRVSQQEMLDALEGSNYGVFAIGVGNEIDDGTLSRIGRSGYIRVQDRDAVASAFQQMGERIVRFTRRFYLLSYCSPARAGKHVVTIEAVSNGRSGQLEYEFDARGFDAGCDAMRPPPFDTSGRTGKVRKQLKAEQKKSKTEG